jgi:hypothetical protein
MDSYGARALRYYRARLANPSIDSPKLGELLAKLSTLPEPLAKVARSIELANGAGDVTGVRKRLFELGIGIVRYAVAVGLAGCKEALGPSPAPGPLAKLLGRAARLSDGAWCELGREVQRLLGQRHSRYVALLDFLSRKVLTDLVSARNRFVHGGERGDDALLHVSALVDEAAPLLATQLLVLGDRAYLASHDQKLALDPWLPMAEGRPLLPDAPHAAGKPWRSIDLDGGEHRENTALTAAVKALVGDDGDAPRPMTDRPALVGRESIVQSLVESARGAMTGGVWLFLLSGPLGAGRTRLLDELLASAAGFGFERTLHAVCSAERRSPLRPIRQAFERATGAADFVAALNRAVTGDRLATRDSAQAAIEDLAEALLELSRTQPSLLVLDDLQWADEQTLSLLRILTEAAISQTPALLFIALSLREEPDYSSGLRKLVGQLERDSGARTRRALVDAVDDGATRQIAQGVAPLGTALEAAVVERAGGIPLFVVQPLLGWNESSSLEWRAGSWNARDPELLLAPAPGVVDLVRARLTSFFEPGSGAERAAEHALALIALSGASVALERVCQVSQVFGDQLLDLEHALEALVEARLLAVSGRSSEYRFEQPILRDAARGLVAKKPWFPRLHRSLLDLMAKDADAELEATFLADGYLALNALSEAKRWLGKALERALSLGAFDEAAQLAERLATLAGDAPERLAKGLLRVDALSRAGRAAAAAELHASLATHGVLDDKLLLRARVLGLLVGFGAGLLPATSDASLEAAADQLGDARLAAEARFVRALCVRGRQGLASAEQGLRALDTVDGASEDLRYRLSSLRLELSYELKEPLEALRHAAQAAMTAAQALRSTWAELDIEADLAVVEAATNPTRAVLLLRDIERRARELRLGTIRRNALVNIAACLLRAEQPREALEAAQAAAEAAQAAGSRRQLATAKSVEADARQNLGQYPEAKLAIDAAIQLKLSGGDSRVALTLLRRATILEKLGELAQARRDVEDALRWARTEGNDAEATRAERWLSEHAGDAPTP